MLSLPPKARRILDKLTEGLVKVGDSRKFDNSSPGFMAACIEIIEQPKPGWKLVSVAHYFEQNGDLCCDPDVTILRTPSGDYPVSFQQAIPPVYRVVMKIEGGTVHVNEKAQKSLVLFITELLTNIADQQLLEV